MIRTLLQAILVVVLAALGLVVLTLLWCATAEKPGQGPKAAAGYRWGAPVVAALDAYRRDHGRYPDSLVALTPRYVAREALVPPAPLTRQAVYRLDSAGYSLTFFYTGPASNDCTYTPARRRWDCSGAW